MQLIVFRYERLVFFHVNYWGLTLVFNVFNSSLCINSHRISDWTSNFSTQEMSMALRCDQLIGVDTVSIFVRKLNPQVTESERKAQFFDTWEDN